MSQAQIQIPPKLIPVFDGSARYRCAFGGRGSGKSFNFAKMAAVKGYARPERILCTREMQVSIDDSMKAEIERAIRSEPWLDDFYEIGQKRITGSNGTEFLFKGLRYNIGNIRSTSGITLCIVEEAEDVPESSWQALTPTIREPGSEIWAIWNPRNQDSPVNRRFRHHTPDRCKIAEMNWQDNPWFTPELEEERQNDLKRLDPNTYAHIWEGQYLTNSDSQILANKWRVEEFTPADSWDGPYHGLDFGFAKDPTAGVRCWVHGGRLYIEYEAGSTGLELDKTGTFLAERIPGIERYTIRADSARPESISYLQRHGLPGVVGVKKWAGSVDDGIQHLRAYEEIIIHPRCPKTVNEARLYSYKVDARSGDVLPVVLDAYNHFMDAIRYAIQPLIRQRGAILEFV